MSEQNINNGAKPISHTEARKIAQKFIDGHFGNPDCVYPSMSIPARETDDDIRLIAYIEQQSKLTSVAAQPSSEQIKEHAWTVAACCMDCVDLNGHDIQTVKKRMHEIIMNAMASRSTHNAEWVLVPREPTREMWAASGDAQMGHDLNMHHDKITEMVWLAMIEAAPKED